MKRKALRTVWIVLAAAALAVGAAQAVFLLRHPYFRKYAAQNGLSLREARKAWGRPDGISELAMGLAVESSLENWDRVAALAAEDRTSEVGTYYYNLANAMRGQLPDRLLDYYQPFERGLFLPVGEHSTPFVIGCAGDVWFALGDMVMAERDAMLGLIFSPAHKGSRYVRRLAETNLVTGDTEAASKFLRMLLDGPRRDRKWAEERLPGAWTPAVKRRIEGKRALLPALDVVHGMDQVPLILRLLLNANPGNRMALDYLLCYDLLTKDLDAFVGDYVPALTASRLYEEAMLIVLAAKGGMNEENLVRYHIAAETLERFNRFVTVYRRDGGSGRNLGEFRNTYWYYFYYAVRNE